MVRGDKRLQTVNIKMAASNLLQKGPALLEFLEGVNMKDIQFEHVGKKSVITQAVTISSVRATKDAATVSPFNERGVVASPSFSLVRPNGPADQFEFSIKAHALGDECWIAEPSWHCNAGHTPGHSQQPSRQSATFKSRSESVDDAISRGMRQISGELGHLVDSPDWQKRTKALRAWSVSALPQVRAHDETLPLRGVQVIDLACGGLGGFGMGLSSLGAQVKLACDIDANARSIYQQNVGPMQMHDDICTLEGQGLECDILTMGLMCQAFSKAGNGLGMQDPNLAQAYKHSMRLLGEIDAKVIIIECVRQLLTAHGGRDAQVVRDTLLTAGYRVQHRTMNTKGFGLPQSRERVFLVATRMGVPTDGLMGYMFPQEQVPSAVVGDIMDYHISADVEAARIEMRKSEPTAKQNCLVEVGRIDGRNSQGYRVYSPMGLGATLTAMSGGRGQTSVYSVNGNARALTPREAGRMQGLPEWAVHHSVKTHACKHAGNAVAIPLVRELVRPLAKTLGTSRVSACTAAMEGGAA